MNGSGHVLGCFMHVLYRGVLVLSRVAFWAAVNYRVFGAGSGFHLGWRTKEKV